LNIGKKLVFCYWFFVVGFAFGHHQTIILVFPTLIFVLRKQIIKVFGNLKLLIASLVSLVLGLVPFFALLIWIAKKKPLLNWGEVEGIKGAFFALTRRDFGTFQSFLAGAEPVARPAPIAHIEYYLRNIVVDFSIVGIIFIILGVWFVWKKARDIFWFIFIGVLVSGFLFLIYASFPLTDSFNQATVRRFHMMPNIFVSLFLAFGIFFLYQAMTSKRVKKFEYRIGVMLGKSYLVLAFLFVIFVNFSKANHREDRMTLDYTNDSFSRTPSNSLILLSGDIPNMTADYFAFVDPGENKRIIFSPGQFHLDWFNKQMSIRHPQVVIPPVRPGKRFTTTTQVIDANYGKWPIYVGPDLVVHDPELEKRYVLYPKHLLFLVKRPGEDLNVEELREENEMIWENIDLEEVSRIKKNTPRFEETIVFHYSRHFFNTGFMYEEVGLYDDAVREYERVLEIDAVFKEAYLGLARINGEKKEEKDYAAAIGYMQSYQMALRPGEEDLAYAAEVEIYKFYEAAQKQAEEEAKLAEIERQGEEATGSGDVKIDISSDEDESEK